MPTARESEKLFILVIHIKHSQSFKDEKMKLFLIILGLLIVALLVAGCVQLSATCILTAKTIGATEHAHMWCVGETYTKDFCDTNHVCHKHKINEYSNLAEAAGAGPHTHQLK